MEENQYQNRFNGISRLYGESLFQHFKETHICVIGIGGVGSWTVEALVRSGIGKITMIDLDEICITNTNRQLHTLEKTIGHSKVQVMKERLLAINPNCEINPIDDFLTEKTVDQLLNHKFDGVIDAIDGVTHKAIIAVHCHKNSLPLVTVGGAGGKLNPTLIQTGDLSHSQRDSLLQRLRKKLRTQYNFPRKEEMGIRCVYSLERAVFPSKDGKTTCFKKDLKDKSQIKLDCKTGMGTASFMTGPMGFTAAYEMLNLLNKKRETH